MIQTLPYATSCRTSELRTSRTLLDNIARFLLGFAENIRPLLLTLAENVLTLLRTNSQTSGAAHTHGEWRTPWHNRLL
jgi:hypothetical protein